MHLHLTNLEQAADATHGFAINSYNINLSLEPGKHENVDLQGRQGRRVPVLLHRVLLGAAPRDGGLPDRRAELGEAGRDAAAVRWTQLDEPGRSARRSGARSSSRWPWWRRARPRPRRRRSRPPPAAPARPETCRDVAPGAGLQAAIDAARRATALCLAAGLVRRARAHREGAHALGAARRRDPLERRGHHGPTRGGRRSAARRHGRRQRRPLRPAGRRGPRRGSRRSRGGGSRTQRRVRHPRRTRDRSDRARQPGDRRCEPAARAARRRHPAVGDVRLDGRGQPARGLPRRRALVRLAQPRRRQPHRAAGATART